jgi:hypothetical protein
VQNISSLGGHDEGLPLLMLLLRLVIHPEEERLVETTSNLAS